MSLLQQTKKSVLLLIKKNHTYAGLRRRKKLLALKDYKSYN
jgi:hypothetical protein